MTGTGRFGREPPLGDIPWSLPAAAGLAAGILLASVPGLGGGVVLAVFGLALTSLWLRPPALLLAFLLALPIGAARQELWQRQLAPVELAYGEGTFSGRSDGSFLRLDEPRGVRVVLAPAGSAPVGRAVIRGTLVAPSGKRNPGGFDYAGYLLRRGVRGQLLVSEVVSSEPGFSLRRRFALGVERGLGPRQAALMQAMTLGLREDLEALRDSFSASGLAHVLALSGLHVGVLVLALGWVLRPLGSRRYPLMLLLVGGFVALVGPAPSVLRAAAMVMAVLLSLWFGAGRLEPWPALGLAGLATLLWNPSWLFDLSFQLSYLAVIGMLLFTGPLVARGGGADPKLPWWHWRKAVLGAGAASLAAQLPSLPLVASAFGAIPLLSPLLNLVAIPAAAVLVPLGFLSALLGLIWVPLSWPTNQLVRPLAALLIALAEAGARLPRLPWGEVGWRGWVCFGVALVALLLLLRGDLRPWRGWLLLTLAGLAALCGPTGAPELVFLDVGQGDSALIRLPGRREILIDGGGTPFGDFDVGASIVVPALRALDVDELELVVASHADADHIEGLIAVLERVPVGTLVIGVAEVDKGVFARLLETAEARGVPVRSVVRGERIEIGGAVLEILNPPRRPYSGSNDNSVAFALHYAGRSRALFLGDAPSVVEAELAVPQSEVLMVAHHGSPSSTSPALLVAVRPRRAVISVGRNRYGHPHEDVLARLAEAGSTVYRTDLLGAVRLPLVP